MPATEAPVSEMVTGEERASFLTRENADNVTQQNSLFCIKHKCCWIALLSESLGDIDKPQY